MLNISLLHNYAPYYMILNPKIEEKNLPTVGGGHPPPPPSTPSLRSVASLPRAWSLRSVAFVLKILSVFFLKSEITPPPSFEDLSTPFIIL